MLTALPDEFQFICKAADGAVVPIPTLPDQVILIRSVSVVKNASGAACIFDISTFQEPSLYLLKSAQLVPFSQRLTAETVVAPAVPVFSTSNLVVPA
jgi:hypothetical protein